MFKKVFLAFLISLFSVGISNAEWKTDYNIEFDIYDRKIAKIWYNKYDISLFMFYDQNNDGKLDKLHHLHYRGQCHGDQIVGVHTIPEIKTVDDLIKYLDEREKKQAKEAKEAKEKRLTKNSI
jgi:hypothetical protein